MEVDSNPALWTLNTETKQEVDGMVPWKTSPSRKSSTSILVSTSSKSPRNRISQNPSTTLPQAKNDPKNCSMEDPYTVDLGGSTLISTRVSRTQLSFAQTFALSTEGPSNPNHLAE